MSDIDRKKTTDRIKLLHEQSIAKPRRSKQSKRERQSIKVDLSPEIKRREEMLGRELSQKEVEEVAQSVKDKFEEIVNQINELEKDQLREAVLSRWGSHLEAFDVMQIVKDFEQVNLNKTLLKLSSEKKNPDLSKIPLWGGKIKDGSAIKWLDKHYGQWLRRCGADQNYIYRQDILAHDEKLTEGVAGEARKAGKKPREYIPTKRDLTDFNIKKLPITPEVKRTFYSIQNRKHRL